MSLQPISKVSRVLPVLTEVRTSPWAKRVAWILCLIMVLGPLSTLWAPWQQNITGSGRVAAFLPLDRQQVVKAPIAGRIVNIWVIEGSEVKKGDRLLEISDIAPEFVERLGEQKRALDEKLLTIDAKVDSLQSQVRTLEASRDLAIEANRARVEMATEKWRAAEQKQVQVKNELALAELQLRRFENLVTDGVVSQFEVDSARLDHENTKLELTRSEAMVSASRQEMQSAEAKLGEVREKANATIDKARAELHTARGDANDVQTKLAELKVKLQRQSSQLVTAPRDGTVFRLLANEGGEIVKATDPLLILVPTTNDSAVELWVRGNDAPLIQEGRKVRLQFEGWPAVQFAGWPSVAVGTFGGVVSLVDPTDNGNGRFRLLITPDPDDEPWPADRFLRQGVRAKGWVLLEEVSLGYEIWRQLNGFPPVISPDEPSDKVARKRMKP